jgi:Fic family protein
MSLSEDTVYALSSADASLGKLAGVGRLIPNPTLLINPFLTREAVASSRIEGTEASISEVFQAELVGSKEDSDVFEVQNYIKATRRGIKLLESLPLSQRMIKEVHGVLMSGVRGAEKQPGEFRKTPVWIGSPTDNPDNATFVPALPDLLSDAISDWEFFVNDDHKIPDLIKCALLHYQFETIHPFLDGNGRLGRLLIVFYLMQRNRMPAPLLYLSAYLESHRREYYDRLQGVRERGEMQEWLQFFLTAVSRQADDAVRRAEALVDLRERYRSELAGARNRSVEVIDLLFKNPLITTRSVEKILEITNQGARNLIRVFEGKEWLVQLDELGPAGRFTWYAPEVLDIMGDAGGMDDQRGFDAEQTQS